MSIYINYSLRYVQRWGIVRPTFSSIYDYIACTCMRARVTRLNDRVREVEVFSVNVTHTLETLEDTRRYISAFAEATSTTVCGPPSVIYFNPRRARARTMRRVFAEISYFPRRSFRSANAVDIISDRSALNRAVRRAQFLGTRFAFYEINKRRLR